MPVAVEEEYTSRAIKTTREPVGPKNAGSKGSTGDVALMDAVAIVLLAWVILFLLGFSLRRHNI
jgi:hypothetical protein